MIKLLFALRKYFHMCTKNLPIWSLARALCMNFSCLAPFCHIIIFQHKPFAAFASLDSIIFFTDELSLPSIVIHLYDHSSSLLAFAERHKYASRATIRKSINIKCRMRLAKAHGHVGSTIFNKEKN